MRYMLLLLYLSVLTSTAYAKECVYVNSYHVGYAWSDKIEQTVRNGLQGKCHLTVFYMDTKRDTSETSAKRIALEIREKINRIQPAVVLVSDDNASKYLVAPYYKNTQIPFAFSGVNWSAEAYGYPYRNATGMIEVSPVKALLHQARETLGAVRSVFFIGVQGVRTDEKEFTWLKKIYARKNVAVQGVFVRSLEEWKQAYLAGQKADFIVLNNVAGIADWDEQDAKNFVKKHGHKLTVSTYDFMAPYAMFAMTKVAEEQGDWMVQLALRVLQGKSLAKVPVVANRRWNMFVNPQLLKAASIVLPDDVMFKAVKIQP